MPLQSHSIVLAEIGMNFHHDFQGKSSSSNGFTLRSLLFRKQPHISLESVFEWHRASEQI